MFAPKDDDSHSIYVWLDALTNYLTCSGYPDEFEEVNIGYPHKYEKHSTESHIL
jgi:methionyl-tRNA synthetase